MATAMKICRVCGKEYPACKTFKRDPNVFRWQDVACSPECGAKYLREVMIARGELVEEDPLMLEFDDEDDASCWDAEIDEFPDDEDDSDDEIEYFV